MSPNDSAVIEPEVEVVEAMTPSVVEALVRGEVDVQIATAKRYPRSLQVFQQRAINMATLDEETAESCLYRRPVGKKKNDRTGKWEEEYAEGMSIRMAEIVGACYGNLRVGCQLVEQTPEFVRARGMAFDLETNFASSSEVIESTLKNKYEGRNVVGQEPMSARMRIVIAKACLSKARRDATFQVVPRALAKPIEAAVRKLLVGDAQSIEKRRQAAVQWITKLGISEARVYAALKIAGPADLTAEKLVELAGIKTAIKDNEVAIDDAFPELEAPQPGQRKSQQERTPAIEDAPPRAGEPPAAASQSPAGVAPSQSGDLGRSTTAPASAQRPAAVTITAIDVKPGGTLITFSSGLRAATKDDALVRGADMAKSGNLRVHAETREPKDPRNVPVLVKITPVDEEPAS